MARLIYSAIMSLDGYTADADGRFEWAAPAEEVFAFVNELERPVGAYLYGRRMYETMRYWETAELARAQIVDVERGAQQAQFLAAEPDEAQLVPRMDLPHHLGDVEDRGRTGRVVEHAGAVDRVEVRVDDEDVVRVAALCRISLAT